MNWREEYRATSKPRAVEEAGDLYLIRPLGFAFVQVLRRTSVTPTMVSFLAVLAGWYTALLYYRSGLAGTDAGLAMAAALMFLVHSGLDSADGQLARLKGVSSEVGRIVDGFCDSVAFLAIYLAVVLGIWHRTGAFPAAVALLAAAGALSHSLQSSLAEYQRSLYLLCVHGKRDIVESDPEREPPGKGDLFERAMRRLHRGYYRRQRMVLASTARLERRVVDWLGDHSGRAGELASLYEERHRHTMKGWALLASNSHKLGVVVSSFIPVSDGGFWSGLGIAWFLVYDLFLNLVTVILVKRQRPIDDGTVRAIELMG